MANEKDYHSEQNYTVTYATIAVLLVGMIGSSIVLTGKNAVLAILALAAVQGYTVLSKLMYMKDEPWLIKLCTYLSVALILIWIFGVMPDTLMIPLVITE